MRGKRNRYNDSKSYPDESKYQNNPDRYEWADEIGWIDRHTGKVVEPDNRRKYK
jgi:hypothetical protein